MSNVNNPIHARYTEIINLMNTLCECYDNTGKEYISLSISSVLRVLLHDSCYKNGKPNSISLLTQIGTKERKYLSTNTFNSSDAVHLGLVRKVNVGVHDGLGGEAKYWPLCDERYFTKKHQQKYLEFEEWWNEEVFISKEAKLTRETLVLQVSNKDGGTHVNSKVKKEYDLFRKTWSGGSSLVGVKSGIKRGYDNIPTYPAIRQIAYELLSSLQS